jgi:general secretion pathway protein D
MTLRRGPNPLRRSLGAMFAAGALAFALAAPGATPAHAEAAAPGPAALTSVDLVEGAGEMRVILTFNQILPAFSIVSNDSATASLLFSGAVRSSSARVPNGSHGLLASIAFDQGKGGLSVNLTGAQAIHISATPGSTRSLTIEITPAPHAATRISAAGSALPSFSDRGMGEDGFEVVPLKYADVSEVVGLLTDGLSVKPNDSFMPQEPAFGSAGMTNGMAVTPNTPPPGTVMNTDPQGQSVDDTIGIDRRLNAIILRGSPERIARLKEKIAKLDVPVTSVILETTFVELTESGARNIGLDFNNAANQIGLATFNSGQFNSAAFGSAKGLLSYSLQTAIYAQVQKGNGRIISRPRISAQSGTTAKIITGDALPILTSIALSGVNAVSQQVQYVNVGVTLQIAPRVSDDGFVTSHVFCEVSSVTGTSQGYPTISQREASTSATVKDGESFVIGGLTQENEITSNSKLPLAGDVPVLGGLFHVHKDTRSRTQLYIVVTPHVVVGGDAAAAAAIMKSSNP